MLTALLPEHLPVLLASTDTDSVGLPSLAIAVQLITGAGARLAANSSPPHHLTTTTPAGAVRAMCNVTWIRHP
jgi:hypothetical protein